MAIDNDLPHVLKMKEILGIDVGATGIKGAIVNIEEGVLITERIKYPTPKPATPQAMTEVMKKLIEDHNWKGKPIGMGFPAIIKDGVAHSASNIDDSWLDFPIIGFLNKKLKSPINVINDADAAGLAEQKFGGGSEKEGLVVLLTLGTGIGSAIFNDGILIPNTELGHLKWKDSVVEKYVSNNARETNDLSFKVWGKELNKVLNHLEFVLSPDHFIIGGGISKKFHKYEEFLDCIASVEPAKMLNNAGIIGAAMAAPNVIE
ncbi:MAG: polyphosphate glucokinase [Saprospiraceae bacterium]|jgi:polyphosphate glucokinase